MHEQTFAAHRPTSTMILRLALASLALGLLAACGGDGGDGGATLPVDDLAVEDSPVDSETDEVPAETADGNSMATLTVDGEVYSWAADKKLHCVIGGEYPVDAYFSEEPSGDGDWFEFFDRGDGKIHFSAYLGGEEYSGTGSAAEFDEVRADGFTYTGSVNHDGGELDAELEVTC